MGNRNSRRNFVIATTFLLLPALSCGPSLTNAGRLPSTQEAFGDPSLGGCPTNRSEPQLDLMGWNGGDRATVKVLRYSGVVPVHYEADKCSARMVVLPNCIGEGAYFYTPHTMVERKTMHNEAELNIPLSRSRGRRGDIE